MCKKHGKKWQQKNDSIRYLIKKLKSQQEAEKNTTRKLSIGMQIKHLEKELQQRLAD